MSTERLKTEKVDADFNRMESFILDNTETIFEARFYSNKELEDTFNINFFEHSSESEIDHLKKIFSQGLIKLKQLLNSNKNKDWFIRTDMFIASNKHTHISKLKYLSNSNILQFFFKDNETFKIPKFSVYDILAIILIDPENSLDDEMETKNQINETYELLLKTYITNEERGMIDYNYPINPKFTETVIDTIFESLEIEFKNTQYPYSSVDLEERFTGLPINENVNTSNLSSFLYLFDSKNQDEETRVDNKQQFTETLKTLIKQNKNGILDFYCKAYFHAYNCGQIDFVLNDEGIEILEGKSSCSQRTGISYLMDFIYALSDNTERTAVQTSKFDIKFTGIIQQNKIATPSNKTIEYNSKKNFPFPFVNF